MNIKSGFQVIDTLEWFNYDRFMHIYKYIFSSIDQEINPIVLYFIQTYA